MADSDYNRDDDRRDRDRDDRRDYDDRPRRRDYDDRPKKKGGGMIILFVVLGAVLLLCVLPCGGFFWFGMDMMNKMTGAGDEVLTKVGAGDFSGGYNMMTSSYKSRKTLDQFTADMKAAKLDKYKAKSFKFVSSNSQNTTHNIVGDAELTDGSKVSVTVVIEQGGNGFQFTVDDIKAPGMGTGVPGPNQLK